MKIAVLDKKSLGDGINYDPLRAHGKVSLYDFTKESEILLHLKGIDVAVSNKIIYTEELLKQLPDLKLICTTGTGYNHIDINAAIKLGVGVCNVVDYCSDSVAQHTVAMVLSLLNKLSYYNKYVTSNAYVGDEAFSHFETSYHELRSLRWGIVGLGNIGKRVADIAKVLGSEVVYYSTSGKNTPSDYKRVDFETLTTTSDIITIHAPLNGVTKDLFDLMVLREMKKDAILVNVGRGGIVNEEDIASAITEHLIGGIGIDVLENEPMDMNSPLLKVIGDERLLVTPHIAWASLEARQRVILEVAHNIEDYISGMKRNRVDTTY